MILDTGRSIVATLVVTWLAAGSAACMRLPEREPAVAAVDMRAWAAVEEARAKEAALHAELERLRPEIALRDTLLQTVLVRHAEVARALEDASERSSELSERLVAASGAVAQLAAERKLLVEALAEARARLELRDADGALPAPASAPAAEPAPPAQAPPVGQPPPLHPAGDLAPVAIAPE